jgi:peptidoglycan/xylan/chitin deacetylase (PgdA/CDA1 family)
MRDEKDRRRLLLRYDVESTDAALMDGFLAGLVHAHREADLPVTLFCTGGAIEAREDAFRAFRDRVDGDARFEIGDHSYSHIGIGYERGKPVAVLRADYERSFAAHERVLGTRPDSLSICGTSGADGDRLPGFDATEKAREELAMLVALGVRRLNTNLTGKNGGEEFTDYAALGFPHVGGFPSAFSDTSWIRQADITGDFLAPLRAEIDRRARENLPMPLICHDWVTWNHAPDRRFTHIKQLAEYARQQGFTPMTHGAAVAEATDAA